MPKVRFRGIISSIRFPKPGSERDGTFTVANATIVGDPPEGYELDDMVTVVGPFVCNEGQQFVFEGKWEKSRYGLQLKVEHSEIDMNLTSGGLIKLIANTPEIKNFGPKRTEKLFEVYGHHALEECRKHPKKVAEAIGVKQGDVQGLIEHIDAMEAEIKTRSWMAERNFTIHQINSIIEALGNNALPQLLENPYRLIELLDNVGFGRADEIALKCGFDKEDPRRIRACLLYIIESHARNGGHTCVDVDALIDEATAKLFADGETAAVDLLDALRGLINEGRIKHLRTPDGHEFMILDKWYLWERANLDWLRTHAAGGCGSVELSSFGGEVSWTDEQRAAIRHAFEHPVSVISGGAGTGKTTVIKEIIRQARAAGLNRIELCAPTGKAAKRMEQQCGEPAQTIHKMLGYEGWRFATRKVDPDVLVVDETSMVDAWLFYELTKRITPAVRVVFVGDHNQLPPVGAGFPFRDILARELVPCVKLTVVQRQAGTLKRCCCDVLESRVNTTQPPENHPEHGRVHPWILRYQTENGARDFSDTEGLRDAVVDVVYNRIHKIGFSASDVQVITAQHKGPVGTQELNRVLQAEYQRRLGREVDPNDKNRYWPGDRVIQTRNDYTSGVFNGTQGVVTAVNYDGREEPEPDELAAAFHEPLGKGCVRVLWEGREAPVALERTQQWDIRLGYCLTAHKAQGSEYPCALVVCHSSQFKSHNRNWLYTALTRARATAILFGDPKGIKTAANTKGSQRRQTLMALKQYEEVEHGSQTEDTRGRDETVHAEEKVEGTDVLPVAGGTTEAAGGDRRDGGEDPPESAEQVPVSAPGSG